MTSPGDARPRSPGPLAGQPVSRFPGSPAAPVPPGRPQYPGPDRKGEPKAGTVNEMPGHAAERGVAIPEAVPGNAGHMLAWGAVGVVAQVAFVAGWLIADTWQRPGYSSIKNSISDLQAATAPHAWFPIACSAVGGLGTFGFAVFGLRPALARAGQDRRLRALDAGRRRAGDRQLLPSDSLPAHRRRVYRPRPAPQPRRHD